MSPALKFCTATQINEGQGAFYSIGLKSLFEGESHFGSDTITLLVGQITQIRVQGTLEEGFMHRFAAEFMDSELYPSRKVHLP